MGCSGFRWQSLRCYSLVELQGIQQVVQLSVLLLHKAIRLALNENKTRRFVTTQTCQVK